MIRRLERAAGTTLGYALAAGAWGFALVVYPPVALYALANAPAWRAFHEFLGETTEALERHPLPTRTKEKVA